MIDKAGEKQSSCVLCVCVIADVSLAETGSAVQTFLCAVLLRRR